MGFDVTQIPEYEEIITLQPEELFFENRLLPIQAGEVLIGQFNEFEAKFYAWLRAESDSIVQEGRGLGLSPEKCLPCSKLEICDGAPPVPESIFIRNRKLFDRARTFWGLIEERLDLNVHEKLILIREGGQIVLLPEKPAEDFGEAHGTMIVII